MAKSDIVFIGIYGSVIAMDKNSGGRVWETKLKGIDFVTVVAEEDRVLAGTHGEIYCLNATTGEVMWHDELRGYRFGLLSIATQNAMSDPAVLAAEQKRRQQSDSSAVTT